MLFHFRSKFPQLGPLLNKYRVFQKRMEVPAKTVLLKEGTVSQNYIFIEKGCLRTSFINHKGNDIAVQFFFENEGLTSIDSFMNDVPSLFTIETIEPAIVYLLPRNYVTLMMDELSHEPGVVRMILEITGQRQIHYINEFVSLIRDTPEQRYINLLAERPHIIKRVPQHYIASYLGVTTVHLSRIKSKIARGGKHF